MIIIAAAALAVIIYVIIVYNEFISLKNRVKNAWADINVQIKRRADLIPNLVNAVKGYARHEKNTLESVTKLRSEVLAEKSVSGKYALNAELGKGIKKVFAFSEKYPSLKAGRNFLKLQEDLTGAEDKIAFRRMFYNDAVYKYNTLLKSFPSSVIGKVLKLEEAESFK